MDMEAKFLLLQVAAPLMSVAAFAPVVLYIVARWRAHKEPIQDTQLGLKFVIHYFATVGFHLGLGGGTLLIYTMIRPGGEDGEPKGDMYRLAFGFLIPAGIVLAAHLALLTRTNDKQFPSVRRLFAGFNLLITGIVGFAALVAGVQALLARGSTGGMGHLGGAAILVYCTAWGMLAWRFDLIVLGGGGFSATGGPPSNIVPPSYPLPPAAAAGGDKGGLPPLGGGSFPPIDPR